MNRPTDNEFSLRIKRVICLTNNTRVLQWHAQDMEIFDHTFHFSVLTQHFDGIVSVLKTANEDIIGISMCTFKEASQTQCEADFVELMESRVMPIHVKDMVAYIDGIISKPLGHRAPDGVPMPNA